jgi:hypothetical protein
MTPVAKRGEWSAIGERAAGTAVRMAAMKGLALHDSTGIPPGLNRFMTPVTMRLAQLPET